MTIPSQAVPHDKVLCIDWDLVVTDWDGTLSKERANEIAKRLVLFQKLGFKIYVVSLANVAHIENMTEKSGSETFIKILNQVEKKTIEKREYLLQIDQSLGESITAMRRMIRHVMRLRDTSTPFLPEWIYGYKKSNVMKKIIKDLKLQPRDLIFLDDNVFNVLFARHNGFRGYLINNHPDITYLNLLSVMDWLLSVYSTNKISNINNNDNTVLRTRTRTRTPTSRRKLVEI